jgi:signal transduction histidine kinase
MSAVKDIVLVDEFDELTAQAERLCDRRNSDALLVIDRVEKIATSTQEPRHLTLSAYLRAYYDCFINNNYDQVISRLAGVIASMDCETFNTMGHKLLMTLGNAYQFKGDLFTAQETYMKGLRGLESKSKLNQSEEIFLASFNYNLSMLLGASELKIESEEYITRAISLYAKHDKKFQLSKCYVAYAKLFDLNADFTNAIGYLYKAIEIDQEMKDPYSSAYSKANLAILLVKINEYEKSIVYLRESLEFYESKNLVFETAMVKFELGQAYIHSNEMDTGLQYIDSAESLMASLDNRKELTEIYKVKAKIMADKGDMATAYRYQQLYIDNLKFFFDNEKTNALTRAKKEFESELKEKEAKLLREKNEEIQEYVYKLEISNNELKQFAHVASHDLREPLRMITSYITLLAKSMKDKLSEQDQEFLKYVVDGSRRMDQLIKDMLRLAKVDANPTIEKIRLNSVIEEIKLNLDVLIKDSGAIIHVSSLPVINADRAQMIQVFQNLIANGIKYNKSTPPVINISCNERFDTVEFVVMDNGIGIPRHLREEAFQIFRRLHKSSDVSGSGIGLAICKKIVESMKGKIRIEDARNGGTVFRLTFGKEIAESTN